MPVDDGGRRHYRGPEAPMAPPRLALEPLREVPHPLKLNPATDIEWDGAAHLPSAEKLAPASPTLSAVPAEPQWSAFLLWYGRRPEMITGGGYTELQVRLLMYEAFVAGSQFGTNGVVPKVEQPLKGTAESRTIVAALELFLDQVIVNNPEEVTSGEWLDAAAVKKLIEQIREG